MQHFFEEFAKVNIPGQKSDFISLAKKNGENLFYGIFGIFLELKETKKIRE